MNNLLITPTILDAYEFAVNAPPSWKSRAYQSFVQKIRREKTPFSNAAKKGMAFEDTVYRVCNTIVNDETKHIRDYGTPFFQKVLSHCIGGEFQQVSKRYLTIDDEEIVVYSKMDVVHSTSILDIKTTLNYKGEKKYLKGWQHKIYTWSLGITHFSYVIAEWKTEEDSVIKDIHTVDYTAKDLLAAEVELVDGIKELISYIHSNGLYEDYFFTFSNNSR